MRSFEASISKVFLVQEVKLLGKYHISFVTLDKGHLQWKFKCNFKGFGVFWCCKTNKSIDDTQTKSLVPKHQFRILVDKEPFGNGCLMFNTSVNLICLLLYAVPRMLKSFISKQMTEIIIPVTE